LFAESQLQHHFAPRCLLVSDKCTSHVTSPFTAPELPLVNAHHNHNQPFILAFQVDISKNMVIGRGEGKKEKRERSYRGRVWLNVVFRFFVVFVRSKKKSYELRATEAILDFGHQSIVIWFI
jgi:hypothetical protein